MHASQRMQNSRRPAGKAMRLSGLNVSRVTIFNYHGLTEQLSDKLPKATKKYWLTPAQFRAHLVLLRADGFHTVLLHELKDYRSATLRDVPSVILTFDDGLVSDYEVAFPLLVEFGMTAVFFVNTANIGQEGYLNWNQLAEMQRHGMSIQSHGHRHVDLTVLPNAELNSELRDSKRLLEDRLGSQVDYLAAPRGIVDRRVIRWALSAGYQAVCSTRCLPAKPNSTVFTRITLYRDVTIKEFDAFLKGKLRPYASRLSLGLLQGALSIPAHLCHVLRYRWIKQSATATR